MKPLISILSLFLVFNSIQSQNCKLQSKTDDFNKTTLVQTSLSTIYNWFVKIESGFMKVDSFFLIKFEVTYSEHKSKIINKESKVQILLENSSILELNPIKEASGDFTQVGSSSLTIIKFQCILTKNQLEQLSKEPIKKIRINYYNSPEDFEIKEKSRKKLAEPAKCILGA